MNKEKSPGLEIRGYCINKDTLALLARSLTLSVRHPFNLDRQLIEMIDLLQRHEELVSEWDRYELNQLGKAG